MADDVDEELSELEARLGGQEPESEDPEYILSEEAMNEILERLWERADDRFREMLFLRDETEELRKDVRKLSKLVLARIGTQEDIHRLADQHDDQQGGNAANNRENTMSDQEEGKSKGFDVKQAAKIGAAVLATAGVGYGIGRWHASRIQQKQQNQAPASK